MKRFVLACLLVACGGATAATAKRPRPGAPPPAGSAVAKAIAAPPAASPPPADTIPELTPELFTWNDKPLRYVFAIEGATIVTRDNVAGYVTDDDKVEWIAKVTKETKGIQGTNEIYDVRGRYLDAIDAFYITAEGRAPMPTYLPLIGKGQIVTGGEGGGVGTLFTARVGESVVAITDGSLQQYEMRTVRGPAVKRAFVKGTKCKPGEVTERNDFRRRPPDEMPALYAHALESTKAGTLIAIGRRCFQEVSAEVWDPNQTTSRFVDLGSFWNLTSEFDDVLARGDGDELWAFVDPFLDILHFANGKFERESQPEYPIKKIFTSPAGELHGWNERAIQRLPASGAKWERAAALRAPAGLEIRSVVLDRKGHYWAWGWTRDIGFAVYRLRETGRVPARPECPRWFVHVVSAENVPPSWSYPSTQKALASFPEKSALQLVEFGTYPTSFGAVVTSRAQGEALVAHLRAALPEHPARLHCFEPPAKRREIPLN